MTTTTVPPQERGLRVEVHVDADLDVPDQGTSYMHCGKCLDEWKESMRGTCSPKEYARQQVAYTRDGIQIWCTRHEINIALLELRAVRTKAR